MKSKNKKILLSSLVLTSVLVLNVATFSLAYALFEQNNTEPVSFGIQQSLSKNVTFYTAYTEGEWGSSSTMVIATNGHVTAGDIPSVSLSGYTFEGETDPTKALERLRNEHFDLLSKLGRAFFAWF